MQPKPVKEVTTFDGKKHEVDIRHRDKTYQAWSFVDNRMIEGNCTSTQAAAVTSWQKQYQAAFKPESATDKPPRAKKSKPKTVAAEVAIAATDEAMPATDDAEPATDDAEPAPTV